MAIRERDTQNTNQTTQTPAETAENKAQSTVVVPGPYRVGNPPWWRGVTSPLGILFLSILVMVSILFFSIGSSLVGGGKSSSSTSDTTAATSSTPASSSTGMAMGSSSTTTSTANVPNATESFGNQPAKYVLDADGAKHFHLTVKQVMWEPVKGGKRILADAIDGTVPGPVIHVTAGDRVRITVTNQLPQATTMHWHGLTLLTEADGVPGVGQKAIEPGKTYTYEMGVIRDEDAGTHWYHSHDNDLQQVSSGFYGAFLIDPRPGSPQAANPIKADVDIIDIISEFGGYYVISGKSYPDTQVINLKHGQTVRIRVIGAGEMMHPMHMHGGSFTIVAEDGHTLASPIVKDTVQIAPGETYDLLMYGWAPPGSIYPFHCHILSHLMNPGQTMSEMGGLVQLVEYAKA
jgi:manganese oxidase